MLNYCDFHLFINSFLFGLKAFLEKPQLLYVDQHSKKQKPKLKGYTYINVKVKFKSQNIKIQLERTDFAQECYLGM